MTHLKNTVLAGTFALLMASCANNTTENATSVAVDSTNLNGAAPVEYQTTPPADRTDTSHQDGSLPALNAGDSLEDRKNARGGSNVSNTTDPRTTSGSKPGTR